ncbi:MAG TPA: undecaprenyl-diphosphate phosphatase [Polyangiaceae bacterium]|jgi:undecaprenyl-diphosphatase|nr:undecaprenyl-diphosphate phosphatase [Polyangiaceae bacterium]
MFGPFGEAAVLGIVQGLTEFLPVSSDGHLALAEILFKLRGGLAFSVLLRVGTLLATVLVLAPELGRALRAALSAVVAPRSLRQTTGGRDALVILLASFPTAAVGLFLRQPVERWTESPLAIGLGFLGTTAALVLAHFCVQGDREQPSAAGALLLGAAQGLSVLPGLSRSASTIAVALWLGVRPKRAFELSMLMSVPAILGAVGLEARPAFQGPVAWAPCLLGALLALATGVVSLRVVRGLVERGHFGWFAFWVGPLALATMGLGLAWPR